MKIKSEKGMASLFGMGLLLSLILGISMGIYTYNSANVTIKSATSALEMQNDIMSSANAAKERNATGAARDALNMALSSITTNYYSSSSSNGSLADELTVSALSKEMKDYHIISLEYDEDKNKFEVQFEDKSGNEYSATLSDNFSILDFETE